MSQRPRPHSISLCMFIADIAYLCHPLQPSFAGQSVDQGDVGSEWKLRHDLEQFRYLSRHHVEFDVLEECLKAAGLWCSVKYACLSCPAQPSQPPSHTLLFVAVLCIDRQSSPRLRR